MISIILKNTNTQTTKSLATYPLTKCKIDQSWQCLKLKKREIGDWKEFGPPNVESGGVWNFKSPKYESKSYFH